MIVVTVELWPHGNSKKKEKIAEMVIVNDGTGTMKRGNYEGSALRKGTKREQRHGRVKNHARQSYNVWVLVRKMLQAMKY